MSTPAAPALPCPHCIALTRSIYSPQTQPQSIGVDSQYKHSDTESIDIDTDYTSHDSLHDLAEAPPGPQSPDY